MQSMKGATQLLGSMNRSMNLPALQRIAMEFEKENDIMDQRQEIFEEATDDMMGMDEEEETDEVVNQVLDEIGVDLGQAVSGVNRLSAIHADARNSWVKRRLELRRHPCPKDELHKLLEVEIRRTMTSKLGLTVYENERVIQQYLYSPKYYSMNVLQEFLDISASSPYCYRPRLDGLCRTSKRCSCLSAVSVISTRCCRRVFKLIFLNVYRTYLLSIVGIRRSWA